MITMITMIIIDTLGDAVSVCVRPVGSTLQGLDRTGSVVSVRKTSKWNLSYFFKHLYIYIHTYIFKQTWCFIPCGNHQ